MKNFYNILFVSALLIGSLLRIYKLGDIPFGLYQDETAIGYNAYSILTTGKDEHNQKLPLYFKSFGDYKLPVYIYLTIPFVKLFGLTAIAVRAPSALFGIATLFIFPFFVQVISKNKRLALTATILLALNPWHIHYSRATFEVSISLFLFLLGSIAILHHTKTRGMFLFGTILFLLNIYTYNLTRLLSPLIYILVVAYRWKQHHALSVQKSEIVYSLICSGIALLPLITTLFSHGGIGSSTGTLITTSASVQAPLIELRSYLLVLPTILQKIFFNIPFLTFWKFLYNLGSYLSVSFFFLTGSSHGNHGIGLVGEFYIVEFPLFLLGIYAGYTQKKSYNILLFLWACITIGVASLTRDVPHATRSFFLIVPMIVMIATGVETLINILAQKKLLFGIGTIMIVIFSYNFLYYTTAYYYYFPIAYAKSWRSADKDIGFFIKQHKNEYEKIIIDPDVGLIYSSLLFYSDIAPREFQETAIWSPDDSEGFSSPTKFGLFEYRPIDWTKDLSGPRTLIITSPAKKPEAVPPLEAFYYPLRPVVFAVKQEIIRYPIQDIAYIAISSIKK